MQRQQRATADAPTNAGSIYPNEAGGNPLDASSLETQTGPYASGHVPYASTPENHAPTPLHAMASLFVKRGLFDNVHEFTELERRIAACPSIAERGSAFEVFAEAYLSTQKIVGATKVWPLAALPTEIARTVGLDPDADKGVDGVLKRNSGALTAYQVKFRSGRPALSWQELSTFMGLTDQADHRVLFTNCDHLPSVINERSRFHCVRGTDLDRLQRPDFEVIVAWLKGQHAKPGRKAPRPHQREALQSLLPVLAAHDRATTIMASATGKTLVALWVAEQNGSNLVLILVPSLALLRQTLHQWMAETSWTDFMHLCVCSDPTVQKGLDEWIIRQADLDFPVTTDAQTVRSFFANELAARKVVFATYQSADVVARGMGPDTYFDLAVFDEAHRTTGREGRRFSQALLDKGVRIRKRLFMTATPRHYDVRSKDEQGDAKLVYSMDVPEVYGPVAHTLSFANAAQRGIICDYRVVVSVVTKEMVTEATLRHGKVLVDGEVIKARQVANQIALARAARKWGIAKVFTFHRSVRSAKSFTASGPEGIGTHLPEYEAYHVNGTMPTVKRSRLMSEFRKTDKAVMSNARCLTEGVDVPAVDMVAFLAPKRSRVDIVQAVGRAMRKESNKDKGFVLVPLFVEQERGETIEEAVQRTDFDDVWQVLQAMQEQDEVLAEIIRDMRQEYGAAGGFDDTRFRERVEVLGPDFLPIDLLRSAITARCVERLGAPWDERFGELTAFKHRFGHCNVPFRWHEDPRLSQWVESQRTIGRRGQLSQTRTQRLTDLGFDWRTRGEQVWDQRFDELKAFAAEHGHCNVPQHWEPSPELGAWVHQQRRHLHAKQISDERGEKLLSLGFEAKGSRDDRFEEQFAALLAFHDKHGHFNIPLQYDAGCSANLRTFVREKLRKQRRSGFLRKDVLDELDRRGFCWDPRKSKWEQHYTELENFRRCHGHCNVPRKWRQNPKLGAWVEHQKAKYADGRLLPKHYERLGKLGFEWPRDAEGNWRRRIKAASAAVDRHGRCDLKALRKRNPNVAAWLGVQTAKLRQGKLSDSEARGNRPAKWTRIGKQLGPTSRIVVIS